MPSLKVAREFYTKGGFVLHVKAYVKDKQKFVGFLRRDGRKHILGPFWYNLDGTVCLTT
jgi:hypothetical protein